jgi:hypothetical protein
MTLGVSGRSHDKKLDTWGALVAGPDEEHSTRGLPAMDPIHLSVTHRLAGSYRPGGSPHLATDRNRTMG